MDNKTGQVADVATVNPKPDESEVLSTLDPQYADEQGDLGSMPVTGSDQTEIDAAELAEEVGIHSENDHQGGIDPLTDAADLNANAEND